ncbi:MAG: hypothetical protein ACRDGL_11625, partial [Candidatus Limnocylindrales bacterium]
GAAATAADADPEPEPVPDWPPLKPDKRALRVGAKRGLPTGLRSCPDCGHPRGRARNGRVASCLCSGVRCRWCGFVTWRPISDQYDPTDGGWWHAPYFALWSHRCERPAGLSPTERQWQVLEPAPEVAEYQRQTTELAQDQLDSRAKARERFARGEDVPAQEMGFLYLAPGLELQRSPVDGSPVVVRVKARGRGRRSPQT